MAIEQLMQAVLTATPAKRRELERVIRGETTDATTTTGKDESRLVTISGAARLLGVARSTLYRLAATKRLDTVELNGVKRITMRSIRQFIDGERPANEKTAELIAESGHRYAKAKASKKKEIDDSDFNF